jgi:tetratricopeptide (TPR) repeat protein
LPTAVIVRLEYAKGCINCIHITHYGYTPELLKLKALARLELLESLNKEYPTLQSLFTLEGMYRTLSQESDVERCHEQAWEIITSNILMNQLPKNVVALRIWLSILVTKLLNQEQLEDALVLIQYGLKFCDDYPPIKWLAGEILIRLQFYLGARGYFEECLNVNSNSKMAGEPYEKKYITYLAAYKLGWIYEQSRNLAKARDYYQLTLNFNPDYQPAKEKLNQLLNEQ